MIEFEGERKPTEQEQESHIDLRRKSFAPGSVGRAVFPDILEGRRRPKVIFDQPVSSLWQKGARIPQELEAHGMDTIGHALHSPEDKLESLRCGARVKKRLREYLESLALTPHAKLLGAVFSCADFMLHHPHAELLEQRLPQQSVPPEREQEIINGVEGALVTAGLTPRYRRVLELRFGLRGDIPRTLDAIAEEVGLSRQRARKIGDVALRKLLVPRVGLTAYLPLPWNSFGRELGCVFYKDLPRIPRWQVGLKLSQGTRRAIASAGIRTSEELLRVDLSKVGLPSEALAETNGVLKEVVLRAKSC